MIHMFKVNSMFFVYHMHRLVTTIQKSQKRAEFKCAFMTEQLKVRLFVKAHF